MPFSSDFRWTCGVGAFDSTWWVPLSFITGSGPAGTQWAILDDCKPGVVTCSLDCLV